MTRWLPFMLATVAFTGAVPARGQDLLDAIADAVDEAMDEGYDDGYDDYDGGGSYYQPQYVQPTSPYRRVWNGSNWVYVPANPYQGPYQGGTVTYPTPVVTPNVLPYTGPGVTIKLEQPAGATVNYLLDNQEPVTIQAGQQQRLTKKGRYVIRFSRGRGADGRDLGEAYYNIIEGNYTFGTSPKGWELFRDKQQPNLVTGPIQTSPAGVQTTPLPSTSAPVTNSTPSAVPVPPPANTVPPAPVGVPGAPAANTVPAVPTTPAMPVAPATDAVPPPPAAASQPG